MKDETKAVNEGLERYLLTFDLNEVEVNTVFEFMKSYRQAGIEQYKKELVKKKKNEYKDAYSGNREINLLTFINLITKEQ